ncbi:GntR family transcriptional regulator [Thalassobacillus devorans]|uniref:GntR family transcriptional regulator n=1 Tax=Thalassobacillus devorans TaxID=279813 RepID=A0ABQ1NL47_9BACI|nr:GntR family transcriptional regulator [Thalassobacillus devorans]NIK27418.1 DNA-binding GntR family transcriptional regulator [Thalassobacillus devorans]GGC77548.1 GntR family transcriptional regulator [Thalassobacillus devorans]
MPIPTNHSKPVRQSAKENAFNQIQQWIIEGTLRPGEKLNDTELANALGSSRTPVRESLQLLEVQGFVKMFPGKSTEVTEIEREAIKDLLPPLAALQSLSAELAIDHITADQLEQLENINERFAKLISANHAYDALKVDEEFHQVIIDISKNTYIKSMVASLQAHVRRHFFHNSIILAERSIEEHKIIIAAMRDGDKDKAAAIMKDNWLRTVEDFK